MLIKENDDLKLTFKDTSKKLIEIKKMLNFWVIIKQK